MASLNKLYLIGNAGRDPELRYTANGKAQASFSLAVNRSWKVGEEWKQETEWFNIIAWEPLAERLHESIFKGSQVFVEGRIATRSWDDDEGTKHYRVEVIASDVKAIGATGKTEGETTEEAPSRKKARFEDDLPYE